jgi:hypothetical protein
MMESVNGWQLGELRWLGETHEPMIRCIAGE